jgi:sugar diacid utilization regulator
MTPFEIEMIRAYAECDMSVERAAKKLYVHSNTIHYHFNKITKQTGLNPRTFSGLVELLSRIERGETDE